MIIYSTTSCYSFILMKYIINLIDLNPKSFSVPTTYLYATNTDTCIPVLLTESKVIITSIVVEQLHEKLSNK